MHIAMPQKPDYLLMMDSLKPGDVILTFDSKLIACGRLREAIRGRQFSHAMIVSHDNGVLEADGYLTKQSEIYCAGVLLGTNAKSPPPLGFMSSMPTKMQVFRHPGIAKLDSNLVIEVLKQLKGDEFGKNYPPASALAGVAGLAKPFLKSFPSISDKVARKKKGAIAHHPLRPIHGRFCSELVARFFGMVELPLFKRPIKPNKVHPADLAKSNLVHMPEMIVSASSPNVLWEKIYWQMIEILDGQSQFIASEVNLMNRITEPLNEGGKKLDDALGLPHTPLPKMRIE